MLYGYWSDVDVDGYEWFYRPGLTGGLVPTNDGRVCVWVGAPSERFRNDLYAQGRPAIQPIMSTLNRQAGRRVAAGRRVGPVRGFPGIRGFVRQAWGPGWALVGDAGHFKDPLSSHGITDALRDAELLARGVSLALHGLPEHEVLSDYQAIRDRLSIRLFEVTDAIASYRWDLADISSLQLELSAAMRDEVDALLELDKLEGPAAA
jgi:flavin-dependent dehydrogenase